MNINLLPLLTDREDYLEINEDVTIPSSLYENTDIRDLKSLKVCGKIKHKGESMFDLDIKLTGTMILPCALSLEDVAYPFEIKVEETIGESEDFDQNYKIISNTLDILPILWENIVLEIPNKITKKDVKIQTSGDGWELTTDE